MGIALKEPAQYEMTKACTCPEGRCVCGKTHFADDDTLAYIATLQSENAANDERIKRMEEVVRLADKAIKNSTEYRVGHPGYEYLVACIHEVLKK